MRRRQWVREGDLIIVWPWISKIRKPMSNIATRKLKRFIFPEKGVLPSDVDIFGMNVMADDFDDEDGLFSAESASNQSDDESGTP